MTYYHIIIQKERRTEPERMAIPITSTVQQGEEWVAGEQMLHKWVAGEQMLHTMGAFPGDITDDQFVMVAEWDGVSPYVIMHKGDYSARNMEYSGWPAITKEQWEGAQQVMEGRT